MATVVDLVGQLRTAAAACQLRGLYATAKWANEQVLSVPKNVRSTVVLFADTAAAQQGEQDETAFALSLFHSKEFERAASVLTECTSNVAVFLRFYCRLLSSEAKRDETVTDLQTEQQMPNPELPRLIQEFEPYSRNPNADSFIMYLYGILLKKSGQRKEAVGSLIRSVTLLPGHWGAWLELVACCSTVEEIAQILPQLPQGIMTTIFQTQALSELNSGEEACELLDGVLLPLLPASPHLLAQRAFCSYSQQNMPEADQLYSQLYAQHPLRLEQVDVYSNILYVLDHRALLANLAQRVIQVDRYRPETCCVVGNYYSKRGQHEKAVQYFQRALRLSPEFAAAWTLMGHEYIEIKNVHAAIACYRRAADINPHDYRAWYSLGQSYELLAVFFYALFYYRKATTLRPYDNRMWRALALCYEKLNRLNDAIYCYERCKDSEGTASKMIGRLYRKTGNAAKACAAFQEYIDLLQNTEVDGDQVDAALYVGQYYARQAHDFDLATKYLTKAMELGGQVAEQAKVELRGIRSASISSTGASVFGPSSSGAGSATPGWSGSALVFAPPTPADPKK